MSDCLWRFLVAAVFSFVSLAATESSAGVQVVEWNGHKVLRLFGSIERGTADELIDHIDSVPPLPHGVPVLLLDSGGGSVSESLAISAILGVQQFHTVIPNEARCASACASIVFIAGKYRTVEPFGLLGQHSCSTGGAPDEACNELLAQHGFRHGVSHGSIAAFVTYTPPDQILWFSREDADGWGLTRYFGEQESGFQKSEPRFWEMLRGRKPAAQTTWRIDFRENGYEAFFRPAHDDEREFEMNVFCHEQLQGRLFLSLEMHGPADAVQTAIDTVVVQTDLFEWTDQSPAVHQLDELVTEVVTEIPKEHLLPFLQQANRLRFSIAVNSPYDPMMAEGILSGSRQNLIFAANHCMSD